MEINDDMIKRISRLANLEFKSEEERLKIRSDLEKILSFMNTLKTIDTTGVDPLIYLSDQENITGKDATAHMLSRKDIFRNAPDHDGTYFKVPKVINKKKQQNDFDKTK